MLGHIKCGHWPYTIINKENQNLLKNVCTEKMKINDYPDF